MPDFEIIKFRIFFLNFLLTPDFTDLPVPFEELAEVSEVQIKDDIKKLLGIENNTKDTDKKFDSKKTPPGITS